MVAVVALAGLGWLAFGVAGEEQAPPMVLPQEDAPSSIPVDPLSTDRSPMPTEPGNPTDGAVLDIPEQRVDPPANTSVTRSPGMGLIRIKVLDSVTNQGIPNYTVMFSNAEHRLRSALTEGGHVGGEGWSSVPLDEVGVLLVEAEGYTPESRPGFSVSSSNPEISLTLYLNPRAPFSGVELLMLDDRGLPIPHLQVTARRFDDPTGAPLWVRRATDPRGIYQLPDLEPDQYKFELAPLDDQGQRRPLLTHEETVTIYGSESHALPIQFRSGALLTISVLDTAGDQRGAEVSLRLTHPEGEVHSTLWRSQVDSEWLERRDGVPARAPATLSEPVPPGTYELTLELTSGERRTITVQLLPGEHREMAIRF